MIMTCGDDEENGGEDDQGDYDLGLHESIALGLQACTEQAAKSVADLLREGCGKKKRKKCGLLPNWGEGGSRMVVKCQTAILEKYFFS